VLPHSEDLKIKEIGVCKNQRNRGILKIKEIGLIPDYIECYIEFYGEATVSRIDTIIGLFCRIFSF